MKTICLFNSAKTWGGGEKWHHDTALYLTTQNYRVIVATKKGGSLYRKLQDHTSITLLAVRVGNLSHLNPLKVRKLTSKLADLKIDLIILNASEDMKFGGLAAKKAQIPHIIYRRGSAIPIKNNFINQYYFSKVITDVLANSEATKKTILARTQNLFPKDKITVIPNGIDVEKLIGMQATNSLEKPKAKLVIGNLGRLVYQKNQTFLLDVAAELKRRNLDFHLIIAGSGKLQQKLYQKTKKLGLEKQLSFPGFIHNPADFYPIIDVFLLPSHWEGFGYVIAEAMLFERPVIGFDVSSNPELIQNGENGYLIAKDDLQGFCNAIEKYYHNPQSILQMGKKGKSFVQNHFNLPDIRQRIEGYLSHILNLSSI